jgi:hypothetical protein
MFESAVTQSLILLIAALAVIRPILSVLKKIPFL